MADLTLKAAAKKLGPGWRLYARPQHTDEKQWDQFYAEHRDEGAAPILLTALTVDELVRKVKARDEYRETHFGIEPS